MKRLLFALVGLCSLRCLGEDQLEKARDLYLNKEVIVTGAVFQIATESDGRYQVKPNAPWLAYSYRGKHATVIAIQRKQETATGPSKINALGETIKPSVPDESKLEFVVRFPDGVVALDSDSLSGISMWLLLPDQAEKRKAASASAEADTNALIGHTLFATALSRLYRPDSSLAQMDGPSNVYVPQLEPLRIVAAKWNADVGCAIAKVESGAGSQALLFMVPEGGAAASCKGSEILSAIPEKLSKGEIIAIQGHRVVEGMDLDAVYYAIGYPSDENGYGAGRKMLIYRGGLIIHVDNYKVSGVHQMGQ